MLIGDSCVLPRLRIFVLEGTGAMRLAHVDPDCTQRLEPGGLPTPLRGYGRECSRAALGLTRRLDVRRGFLKVATRLDHAKTIRIGAALLVWLPWLASSFRRSFRRR